MLNHFLLSPVPSTVTPSIYLGIGQSEAKFRHPLACGAEAEETTAEWQPSLLPSLTQCPKVSVNLSVVEYNLIPFEREFGEDLSLRWPFHFLFIHGQTSPDVSYQLRCYIQKCVISHKVVPRSKTYPLPKLWENKDACKCFRNCNQLIVKKSISSRDLNMQFEDLKLRRIFLGFQNYIPIYWESVV